MEVAVAVGVIIAVIVVALIVAGTSVRVVQQFERGVVFRLGRVSGTPRQPGLTLLVPVIDRMQKANMQVFTMDVPGQDCITRDNVSVRVDAVIYFRVIDPIKAIVNVQNYMFSVSQFSQTSLRSVIGKADLDELLSERDKINAQLKEIIDEPSEQDWGVRVERVEVKDVVLPEGMKRSMSHQAEAERDRRARVITADGEYQASQRLSEAAERMSKEPGALQLRLLQTVVDVASERNSTLVMPVPVELLRFFEKSAEGLGTQLGKRDGEAGEEASAESGVAGGDDSVEPAEAGSAVEAAGDNEEPAEQPQVEAARERMPVPGLEGDGAEESVPRSSQ